MSATEIIDATIESVEIDADDVLHATVRLKNGSIKRLDGEKIIRIAIPSVDPKREQWIDAKAAAKRLGISMNTLRAYTSRGVIPHRHASGGQTGKVIYATKDIAEFQSGSIATIRRAR